MKDEKLAVSIAALEHALTFSEKINKDSFYFAGISKSFEVCMEYAWKYFKRVAEDSGIEVFSPKDAIRAAGPMGLIDNVEDWITFINQRNLSVRNDIGVGDEEHLATIQSFLRQVKRIPLRD